MESLCELYRIGLGSSSSHTMGPAKAAEIYLGRHPGAKAFEVTLYGSLAATGVGHFTDRVSFDEVVATMLRTGHDLPSLYRETAEGGLAAHVKD